MLCCGHFGGWGSRPAIPPPFELAIFWIPPPCVEPARLAALPTWGGSPKNLRMLAFSLVIPHRVGLSVKNVQKFFRRPPCVLLCRCWPGSIADRRPPTRSRPADRMAVWTKRAPPRPLLSIQPILPEKRDRERGGSGVVVVLDGGVLCRWCPRARVGLATITKNIATTTNTPGLTCTTATTDNTTTTS